jgi:ADP-heptose:LPS heptosyltransferase
LYYKIVNRKKRILTAAADLLGYAVGAPVRFLTSRREPIVAEAIRRILIVRTAYIGDVVMTIPVLKPLKARFPQAHVAFLTATQAAPVLENNPYLDEVITYDPFWFYPASSTGYRAFIQGLRRRPFDLVIEARGDIRELFFIVRPLQARYKVSYRVGGGGYFLTHVVPYRGLAHKVEYHLDLVRYLGCETGPTEWGVYLTDTEKRRVGEILGEHSLREPFIAAHPGSRVALKRWPAEKCAALYDALIATSGLPLVVLGVAGERPFAEEILRRMRQPAVDLVGKLGLRELAGTLARSRVFVCNDSAPMHIAAAMKTPTVAIFGPSKSVETGPYGPGHRVVEKDFPCRASCDENTCRHVRHNACMKDLQVDEVHRAVSAVLEEAGPPWT